MLLSLKQREREMKGTSKVIMGATLIMIVSIAILLGLVLILLAELYCSLLFRRKRDPRNSSSTVPISRSAPAIAAASEQHSQATPSLSDFYTQGVIDAPRNLLFPWVFHGGDAAADMEKQRSGGSHEFCGSPTQQTASTPHNYRSRDLEKKAVSLSSSSPPFLHLPPPKLVYEVPHNCSASGYNSDEVCGGGGGGSKETYIYICNPIYDNEANRAAGGGRLDTPFETPDSSPSRLETNGSPVEEGEDYNHDVQARNYNSSPSTSSRVPVAVSTCTPPLTPMKKLPAEAISINLRDAGSLATSGSESNSNNEGISSTLSSSGSPCTSPSW